MPSAASLPLARILPLEAALPLQARERRRRDAGPSRTPVVVAGLQDWRYAGSNWRPVEEERLVTLLRQQLGAKLSPGFVGLRRPPMYDEDRRDPNAPGVEIRLFPTWFLVDEAQTSSGEDTGPGAAAPGTEKRRRIVEFGDLTVSNAGKLSFKGDAKKAEVNPIRFVGACAKGHLQDIDWRFLAHRNGDRSCRKPLFWVERGVSSDPSDVSVRCACGATVTLADLYKPKFLGGCQSHSPWLTPRRLAEEACSDDLRLLPRSATNTYFPQTVTVISLTKADDRVRQAITEHKTTIDGIRALPNFLDVLRASAGKRNASTARPFTSAPHTGRSIPCHTPSWRSLPSNAAIPSPR